MSLTSYLLVLLRVMAKHGNLSHQLCLHLWDSPRHSFKGSYWGFDTSALGRITAWVCSAKTCIWSPQKPRDFTPPVMVLSHPPSLMHILISHLSNQAIQSTDFSWGNAQRVFGFQEEKHSSWAHVQYFEDILILQWSKNRNGLIQTVQFHSYTDQLSWTTSVLSFQTAGSRNNNYFGSSVTRKLRTNETLWQNCHTCRDHRKNNLWACSVWKAICLLWKTGCEQNPLKKSVSKIVSTP